jgi:hypothetical protein
MDWVRPDEAPDLDAYDTVVLANLRPSGGRGEKSEAQAALRWAERLEAYRGRAVRSERDVHPCAQRDGRCVNARSLQREQCGCGDLIPAAFERLFNACTVIQYLSPRHRELIERIIDVRRPGEVIASPVDMARFRPLRPWSARKDRALILGDALRAGPGAEDLARHHGFEPERIRYHAVPHDDMPELLNQYRAVVMDPVMFHAFGRLAVEAMACGCRLIGTERVGALSWDDPLAASRRANADFWRMVLGGGESV